MVEIIHMGNKGKFEFVIERLYRGSVINHNSFLLNDSLDIDAKCKENVSVYYMTLDTLKLIKNKHQALDNQVEKHAQSLVEVQGGKFGLQGKDKIVRREPAIDYIICDSATVQHFYKHKQDQTKVHNYRLENYRRHLTTRMKNVFLHMWIDVQKNRNKKTLDDVINDLVN
mmetsp:Transcript_4558/g.6901  ORF Transcript_4558/g.6901 Transcript_4558/m.6901 type:complete len:170 (+) Transcript_4558:2153-2662(+)